MIHDILTAMVADGGALSAVNYLFDPELPREIIAIRFGFEAGDWLVSVDPDDDTITIDHTTAEAIADLSVVEASTLVPWAAVP